MKIMDKTELKNTNLFTPLGNIVKMYSTFNQFTYPSDCRPHSLCLLAVEKLQKYLAIQQEWEHNFGLETGKEGKVIGKMFGVLLVETEAKEIGYLSAFSGKLAGGNHHPKFVPPVFDNLQEGGFLNDGMDVLRGMGAAIKELEDLKQAALSGQIKELREQRKMHSTLLQEQLFEHYHFLNYWGEQKGLLAIFEEQRNGKPPSGAGECAAPKLLHYAFQHKMKPLSLAEFWWGQSPKSARWKHKHFYPVCRGKCDPILTYMFTETSSV